MATTLVFNPITGNFDSVLLATANVQAWMATPSSANLLAAMSDKTGTGLNVFGTAPTLTGPVTLTEAVGSSALTITGATQTASFPALSITQTWNNAAVTFTGALFSFTNTASASASLLFDWKVGGTSVLKLGRSATDGLTLGSAILRDEGSGQLSVNRKYYMSVSTSIGLQIADTSYPLSWGGSLGTSDLFVYRDAANVLAQRNSTNAQTFRIYESYVDASNNSRLIVRAQAAADFRIYPEANGTGTLRGLQLVASGGRLGFFGTTAIAKITTGVTAATFAANTSGIVDDTATFGGYTLGQIAKALQNYGLLT